MSLIERKNWLNRIPQGFQSSNIVALLGPRQCGKTTLARLYFQKMYGLDPKPSHYFDLEHPADLQRLQEPMLALEHLQGLIVIDEVQRMPNLFTSLRVLVDEPSSKRQFLLLGSASRLLLQQTAESLAGRIHYIELVPFTLQETQEARKLWIRGGFPPSYLANNDQLSAQWRKDYIRTFLEQDIPNLGLNLPAHQLRRCWMLLAHYHGQIFNASEIGHALQLSHHTVKRYLDVLLGTFMIRSLQPWYENIGKRQVKSSKIYLRDSGLLHSLFSVQTEEDLLVHPKIGASWEGFALEAVINALNVDSEDCFFWAIHGQAELDLLLVRGQSRIGFEFKYSQAPTLTRSMHIALEDLKLDRIIVIYPGNKPIRLTPKIEAMGLEDFLAKKDL